MHFFKPHLRSRVEYGGLLSTGPAPWWFRFTLFLQEQWSNPIFQRNYVRLRVGMPAQPWKVAVWFLFGSYIFNVVILGLKFILGYTWDDMLAYAMIGSLVIGPGIIYVFVLVKVFISCLITTSSSMKTNLGAEEPDAVMSTPLTDKDLFFGEVLPNFVGGIDLGIYFTGLIFAVALPFFYVTCVPFIISNPQAASTLISVPFYLGSFGMWIGYLVANFILMMLMLSYAVGRWTFGYSIFGSVALALLHYLWISFLASLTMIFFYGFMGVLPVLVMIWGVNLTARSGVDTLAKFRRQGEYYAGRVISADGTPMPKKVSGRMWG